MSIDESSSRTRARLTRGPSVIAAACSIALVSTLTATVGVPSYLRNLVDPVVRTTVTESPRLGWVYEYTVANGDWATQDIREIRLESAAASVVPRQHWSAVSVVSGLGRTGVLWTVVPEAPNGVPAGAERRGFRVSSAQPPAIVRVRLGHDLRHPVTRTVETAEASQRLTQWALGPSEDTDAEARDRLLTLAASVRMAAELGWIWNDHISNELRRGFTFASNYLNWGRSNEAVSTLHDIRYLVESNAGVQLNEEAYALVVYNIDSILKQVRTQTVSMSASGAGETRPQSGQSIF